MSKKYYTLEQTFEIDTDLDHEWHVVQLLFRRLAAHFLGCVGCQVDHLLRSVSWRAQPDTDSPR